jgi:dienelactone hydrolase
MPDFPFAAGLLHAASVLVLLAAGAGTAAAQGSGPDEIERLLAYDAAAPLDVHVVGTTREGDVVVEDVTFDGGAGQAPVEAYVVRPAEGAGPFAGVLFVHWFAPPQPTSNRTQFLEEARVLARHGTVSVLVSTMWSDPGWFTGRRWEDDFRASADQAKALRRALDVLVSRPGVDPQRIGYVGHDFGAMFGALVAAADPRPKAYVLVAGAARFEDWYLYEWTKNLPTGDTLAAYRQQLAALDPVHVLPRAKAAVFFQFGEQDFFTPRDNFLAFYQAAPDPKRIATYASEHEMDAPIIRLDRQRWLTAQLGIPLPPAAFSD